MFSFLCIILIVRSGIVRYLVKTYATGGAPLATVVTLGDCCPNKTQMAPIMQFICKVLQS